MVQRAFSLPSRQLVLQSATLQARVHELVIVALTAASNPLANMATWLLPLPDTFAAARYGVLMTIDLLPAELSEPDK